MCVAGKSGPTAAARCGRGASVARVPGGTDPSSAQRRRAWRAAPRSLHSRHGDTAGALLFPIGPRAAAAPLAASRRQRRHAPVRRGQRGGCAFARADTPAGADRRVDGRWGPTDGTSTASTRGVADRRAATAGRHCGGASRGSHSGRDDRHSRWALPMVGRATAGQARRIRGATGGGRTAPPAAHARRAPRAKPRRTPLPPARTRPTADSGHNQCMAGRTHGLPPRRSRRRSLTAPTAPCTATRSHWQAPTALLPYTAATHSVQSVPPRRAHCFAPPTGIRHSRRGTTSPPPLRGPPDIGRPRQAPPCAAAWQSKASAGSPRPTPAPTAPPLPRCRPGRPHRPARRRPPRLHGGRPHRAAPRHAPLAGAEAAAAGRLHPTDPFCRPRARAARATPLCRLQTPRIPPTRCHGGRGRQPARPAASLVPRTHRQCMAGSGLCGIRLLLGTLEVSPRGRQRGLGRMPTLLTARGDFNNVLHALPDRLPPPWPPTRVGDLYQRCGSVNLLTPPLRAIAASDSMPEERGGAGNVAAMRGVV